MCKSPEDDKNLQVIETKFIPCCYCFNSGSINMDLSITKNVYSSKENIIGQFTIDHNIKKLKL